MKLPVLAAIALIASVGAASAQWGPRPPPPPSYGYGYGYGYGAPYGYYAGPRRHRRTVYRCWKVQTRWGVGRECGMVPVRRY